MAGTASLEAPASGKHRHKAVGYRSKAVSLRFCSHVACQGLARGRKPLHSTTTDSTPASPSTQLFRSRVWWHPLCRLVCIVHGAVLKPGRMNVLAFR
eukprot:CAMPEP_0172740380 /NCGR_PEP_ID=MMETSP1074-20121228/124763_1 /TAXON_ID=2916 /ORGANISM="Ceratium fusus, Strain PA161109" /LENGTH=96 /DNA_ID=CAMNT_0013570477 /DNA_START=815 /DNA_END=1101 /DNA_ORIENTATION=-